MEKEYRYNCEPCKYGTDIRQYYYAHNKTKKHYRKCQMNPQVKQSSKPIKKIQRKRKQIKKEKVDKKEDDKWRCPKCEYEFKHHSSFYRHKGDCEAKVINNIQNAETINNNTTNNINIIFNLNSMEEVKMIKAILTPEKIMEICEPEREGRPRQTYDIVKKIQSLSIESKKNCIELQNFKKTNARDNLIDVFKDDKFCKVHFKQYNLEDLLKFANMIMDKCEEEKIEPDKSYDEKLDLICDVLKDYDYYNGIKDTDGTIEFIIDAIDECEKESKLAHYNMTNNNTNSEIII